MSVKKASERLFEDYCRENSIHFRRIEEGDQKCPDYYTLVKNELIVFEVKQFDLNDSDKTVWEEVNKGNAKGYAVQTKYRIRKKIKRAKKQLKRFSSKPTVLLLFDNTGGLLGLDSDDILQAMFGDEVFKYLIPESLEIEPLLVGHSFGRGRSLSKERSRYISGIAKLFKSDYENNYQINFFHNYYASNPIDIEVGSKLFNRQFQLVENENDNFAHWVET